jgi:hypothetical protein
VAAKLTGEGRASLAGCPQRQQARSGPGFQAAADVFGKAVFGKLACLHTELPQDITRLIQGRRAPKVVRLAADSREHRSHRRARRVIGDSLAQVGQDTVNAC